VDQKSPCFVHYLLEQVTDDLVELVDGWLSDAELRLDLLENSEYVGLE